MRTGIDQLNEMTTRMIVEGRSGAKELVHRMGSNEEGQGTAEYVAVIVLIAAVIGLVVSQGDGIATAIKDAIVEAFNKVKKDVTQA
jgi:Flp pilus assembly pilin Flp